MYRTYMQTSFVSTNHFVMHLRTRYTLLPFGHLSEQSAINVRIVDLRIHFAVIDSIIIEHFIEV